MCACSACVACGCTPTSPQNRRTPGLCLDHVARSSASFFLHIMSMCLTSAIALLALSVHAALIPPIPIPSGWTLSASSVQATESPYAMFNGELCSSYWQSAVWTSACWGYSYTTGMFQPGACSNPDMSLLHDGTSVQGEWVQFCAPPGEAYTIGDKFYLSTPLANRGPNSLAILSGNDTGTWTLLS